MGVELEYGEVSAVDYMTCRIRVRLDDRDGVESYWLNVPQRNTQGTQRRPLMPELNEQVAVLLDSDGVGGVYLGGIFSTAEPPPVVDADTDYVRFSDGTVSTYDRAAGVMTLDCVGALLLKCGRNITVEAGEPVVVKAPSATLDIPQVA
ncbi:phage baseplate assembly protein V [Pseudomonas fluorescens]|uniref:phage baseplate assembly protein V n=1 Tax=Pseudomonas TaxID=286 RepID=UPI0020160721|nr:phage baseplate assembly protein V [Pseudomonas fluorescens]